MPARPREAKQRPWREDPAIRDRVMRVHRLACRGRSSVEIAAELDVTPRTVANDRKRAMAMLNAEMTGDARIHVAELMHLAQVAYADHEMADERSRGQYVQAIRAITMDIAKLDGSLSERVELTGAGGGPLRVEHHPSWLTVDFVAQVDQILGESAQALPGPTLALPPAEDDAAEATG